MNVYWRLFWELVFKIVGREMRHDNNLKEIVRKEACDGSDEHSETREISKETKRS